MLGYKLLQIILILFNSPVWVTPDFSVQLDAIASIFLFSKLSQRFMIHGDVERPNFPLCTLTHKDIVLVLLLNMKGTNRREIKYLKRRLKREKWRECLRMTLKRYISSSFLLFFCRFRICKVEGIVVVLIFHVFRMWDLCKLKLRMGWWWKRVWCFD